jgi:hypothetical protein
LTFANDTTVPVERSKAEIERLLGRYGAARFMSGWDGDTAVIGFVLGNRTIRFTLPLPAKTDKQFHRTPTGRQRRNPADAERAWEQACRSRWRALLLVIKAKLEAVQVGISTVEDEFLAWTVLPGDGRTVGERLRLTIDESVRSGKPALLALGCGGAS